MANQQKDNSGALFKNDKKTTDAHPNARGQATIDGVEYWVSAWTKTSGAGVKYQSLAFTRNQSLSFTRKDEAPAKAGKTSSMEDMEDDIPF